MKCDKARELLSERHNGELEPGAEAGLTRHLEGCEACRQAGVELDEMMQLLGEAEPPTLPEGFGSALHERLLAVSEEPMAASAPLPATPRALWVGVLRGVGLACTGAAAALLIFWVAHTPEPSTRVRCPTPGRAVAPSSAGGGSQMASRPPAPDQRLRVGQVAVLVLSIRANAHHADARLQVVLPDGVSLVGEGARDLEEKHMEWTASLSRGENEIRIPVRARRAGTWRLVARARAKGLHTASEARLVVTPS